MKRIAVLLAGLGLAPGACKTTDSTPQPAPSEPAPTPTVRSARPAPALPAPALPAAPAESADGSDRPTPADRGWRGDRMARMDKDGDGKISDEEREAAMKERSERMRQRYDTNGDGKLTPEALAATQGRMKFDDPAARDAAWASAPVAVWTPGGCGVAITSNITPAANTEPCAYANEPAAALSWVPSWPVISAGCCASGDVRTHSRP